MLIILSCLLLSFATYAVGKPDPSLVGYWPFDEKTGKKAEDASGNGNDGKLIDEPKWVEGKFGSALEFGGDGSYVEVADDPIFGSDQCGYRDGLVQAHRRPNQYQSNDVQE